MELEDALITVIRADEKSVENLEGPGKDLVKEIRSRASA